ncbi:hypothetical protein F8388_025298 [Cannabis sativa]|uniref:hAT-like transposase RNase-H fold domain-containing protein n=1 Tax=Cannabis sativa TaxID=3483 RepID=A0A7J6FS98_CANSA|nr:hypothetical protein F8388_025298 [Cannabis sativa]
MNTQYSHSPRPLLYCPHRSSIGASFSAPHLSNSVYIHSDVMVIDEMVDESTPSPEVNQSPTETPNEMKTRINPRYCGKDFTCDCRDFDASHLWNHFNNGCEFSPAEEGLDKKQKLKNMKMKYDKYWGSIDECNEALLIALVLDPRYKLRYLKHCFSCFHDSNTTNEMVKRVEQIVQAMYDHYGGVTTSFDQFQSQAIVIMLLVMLNLHPNLQSTEKNLGTEFT